MSTVGKVLCVLIAFPALAWMWLASGVAETNRQYGKKVQQAEAQLVKDAAELETVREQVYQTKAKIELAQELRDSELAVMRGQLSQLFKSESMSKETADRLALQLASARTSLEAAERRVVRAEQDQVDTRQELADATTELEKVRGENQRDRKILADLRDSFQQLLTQDRTLVEEALKAEQARSQPTGGGTISR